MAEPIKILHLEDIQTDAELIHRELRKANLLFEVRTVDNKEDYAKALVEFNPQVILSDHSLPFFNSHEALALLQEFDLNIPFILVTATVSEEFAVDSIKRGATDYLLKDRLQRLPRAIEKAVENATLETEHKKFLQEIVNNEALMNDAQMHAHFGSFDIDLIKKTLKLSNQAFAIFGYKAGEDPAVHQIFYNNRVRDNIEKIRISVGGAFIDLTADKKTYTLIDKHGQLKFISAEFKSEKNKDGSIVTVKGFLYDITKLKSAENLLQRSEANLKAIFETTDTGYILLSQDQKIILFNKPASVLIEEQSGLLLKEGVPMSMYIGKERRNIVGDKVKKAGEGEGSTYEASILNEKGDIKWYFVRWFPVTGSNNMRHGIMLAISDITGRKQAEIERTKISADLIIRNNALEQFSYIVSHNLRAPVANILGISDVLGNWGTFKPADIEQFLLALTSSTKQLDGVVYDLNQILRISQRVNEERKIAYFQQLVEDIKTELSTAIKKNAVVIKTDFFDKMHTVAIKSFLHSIFYNLILNSIQFRHCSNTPVIKIKSRMKDKKFQLIFSDNGRGIDLKKFGNKIFGLYQKFDTTVDSKGMGLCIVKTLVDTMGGSIRVESGPQAGATFIIELPL